MQRKVEGFEWIKQVNSQVLQQVIIRLDKAFKSFFSGAGYPKFAKEISISPLPYPNI